MILQLHDAPSMAAKGPAPLVLPDVLLVPKKEILQTAIDEALPIIQKKIDGLTSDNDDQLKFWDVVLQVAVWITQNWATIKEFFSQFAKTVDLVQFNRNMRLRYSLNEYNVQRLNDLNAAQIKTQLERMANDMVLATAEERPDDVAEIARFAQVYNMRLSQLPQFDLKKGLLAVLGVWSLTKIFG